MQMKSFLTRFVKNESGATAIEYGLIAALISIVIIVGVRSIGTKLSSTFDSIQSNLPG
jgi:pilus assembly protein Flp/PilA